MIGVAISTLPVDAGDAEQAIVDPFAAQTGQATNWPPDATFDVRAKARSQYPGRTVPLRKG